MRVCALHHLTPSLSDRHKSLLLDAVDIAVPGQPRLQYYLAKEPVEPHLMSGPQIYQSEPGAIMPHVGGAQVLPAVPSPLPDQAARPHTNGTNGHDKSRVRPANCSHWEEADAFAVICGDDILWPTSYQRVDHDTLFNYKFSYAIHPVIFYAPYVRDIMITSRMISVCQCSVRGLLGSKLSASGFRADECAKPYSSNFCLIYALKIL